MFDIWLCKSLFAMAGGCFIPEVLNRLTIDGLTFLALEK